MKYKRTKHGKNFQSKSDKVGKQEIRITKEMLRRLRIDETETVKFLQNLSTHKDFSVAWVNTVLKELVMKCMGVSPVVITHERTGIDVPMRVFMPTAVNKALQTIAEINKITEPSKTVQNFQLFKFDLNGIPENELKKLDYAIE